MRWSHYFVCRITPLGSESNRTFFEAQSVTGRTDSQVQQRKRNDRDCHLLCSQRNEKSRGDDRAGDVIDLIERNPGRSRREMAQPLEETLEEIAQERAAAHQRTGGQRNVLMIDPSLCREKKKTDDRAHDQSAPALVAAEEPLIHGPALSEHFGQDDRSDVRDSSWEKKANDVDDLANH